MIMGWANCGTDSEGRNIGYAHEATCDFPGCNAEIHRGLSYACGDMHGEDEIGCEKYFCGDHLEYAEIKGAERCHQVCFDCYAVHVVEDGLVEENNNELD
jgi:hypothetical protein